MAVTIGKSAGGGAKSGASAALSTSKKSATTGAGSTVGAPKLGSATLGGLKAGTATSKAATTGYKAAVEAGRAANTAFKASGGQTGGGGAGDSGGGGTSTPLPTKIGAKAGTAATQGLAATAATGGMSKAKITSPIPVGSAAGLAAKSGVAASAFGGMSKLPTQTTAAANTTSGAKSNTNTNVNSKYNSIIQSNTTDINVDPNAPGIPPEVPPPVTPEGDIPITEDENTPVDYDPVGDDIALSQAEYMQQSKEQEEFMRQQRGLQTQIDTLTGEIQQIQSSAAIKKTGDDLDKLKHNIAYLGSQGQPGLSSVKLDAVSKQIADAEKIFFDLKRLETDKESQRRLGLEMDAASFERQMVQLQNDLDSKVNSAIQESLNGFNAAEMKGEMDTVEDVAKLKGTLFQNLDKAIAGKIVANATDRKLIIDRYNQTIATTEAFMKNKSVVNKDLSALQGFAIDGNGNPILGTNGSPIAYPKEPPMAPIFDKESGNLITFSTGANGGITTTVQKVFTPTDAGVEWKQASGGGYYRTVNGQLETMGSNGQPTGVGGGTSGYSGPQYQVADYNSLQTAFKQATRQGDGAVGGQCGAFVNDYLQSAGVGRIFTDPIDKKKAAMNSTTPTVGSIAIMDSVNKPQYGHVGIVTAVNDDGTLTIKQSNRNGDEKIFTSKVSQDKVYGYFDPQIPMDQALMQGGISGGDVYNTLSAEDRGLVDLIANYDAPLPSSRNKNYSSIMAAAKEANPNFDAKKYPTQQKFMSNWTSGLMNTNKLALNTTLGHISTLLDSTENISSGKFKPLNQAKNRVADVTGNPNLVGAKVSAYAVASEIAKVFKGGASPTEDEISDWKKVLNTNMSSAQWKTTISKATYLLASRAKSLGTSYKIAMGEDAPIEDYIFPESQSTLQRLGMDVNKFAGAETQQTATTNQYSPGVSTGTGRRLSTQR